MEYITRNCPECNGELRISEDLTTCICMYCGKTFDLQDKEQSIQKANNMAKDEVKRIEENYQQSLESMHKLLDKFEDLMNNFNKRNYKYYFDEFAQTGRVVLEPAENYYEICYQNKDMVITEITDVILDTIKKIISEKPNRKQKETHMHFRFFLTCYLVPMIRILKFSLSEPLAESIVATWNAEYPKSAFQKAEFDQLLAGFTRKGLCFITTAVCETMNKQDDCYELTAFRKFRDDFMLHTPDGIELVDEYYQIAPAIVTFINMEPNRSEKYLEIWHNYLKDCLVDIEKKRFKSCEKRYSRMVRELKREYYIY